MRQTKGLMAILIILIAAVNINAVLALDGMPNSVLTNYSLSGEQIFPNINGWFNQSVILNITSTDASSSHITQVITLTGGVSYTYTVSGGPTTTFTTYPISVEGTTTVKYYAIGDHGTEPENTNIIRIDRTKPVINSVTLNPSSTNTGTAILVTVDASDNIGLTEVNANGASLAKQSGNIWNGTIIAIEDTHSVNLYATDAAGNVQWNNSTSYTATTPCTTCSGGGGGGGGGGSGGVSGENYFNIEIKEKYDLDIYKDKTTSFRFKNSSNPIVYVNITGNVNAGERSTSVEVLRKTSTLLNISAPDVVYKNMNIWVGTSGFATSKNIKEAVIGFKVLNSWLADNSINAADIKLVKWEGSNWVQLETMKTMTDSTYTYYDAKTITFSNFAITGVKAALLVAPLEIAPAETITSTSPSENIKPVTSEKAPAVNLVVIVVGILIVAILIVAYLRYKKP